MSEENTPRTSIFRKVLDAASATLDAQIRKSSSDLENKEPDVSDLVFGKSIVEDPTYSIHSSGWKEKVNRIENGHLKTMSKRDSVIASVIQTRQNQVSNHSKYVTSKKERGWTLQLRNEDELLEEMKEEILRERGESVETDDIEEIPSTNAMSKAFGDADESYTEDPDAGDNGETEDDNDDQDKHDWELEREAKARLEKAYAKEKAKLVEIVRKCGVLEGDNEKPFHARQWNFDSYLRALVRDSLTYDLYATEVVYTKAGKPAYFFPVDGGTIKFSSNRLKDYDKVIETYDAMELLYPEKEAKARAESKSLELDPEKLENNDYKWVQVIRGRIERAYTDADLKVGIRNQTTDIWNNGYGISELELLITLVTGHLNAEFYNQAYFTQGFSAKGILHIKAQINRRKLETIRQKWNHMLKGSRNSFQTPIFAGMDEVEWIPLTQNHEDIGFEGWMRYLIKMICAIYQIDPQEIGIGFKEEGGSGSGMSGDNTEEKLAHSKDKGLYPLLRHLQNYLNEKILKAYSDKFELVFTGVTDETEKETLDRQKEESGFKKTVNEIRAEDGLPPLPGCDDLILNTVYLQWYTQFSEAGKEMNAQAMGGGMPGGDDFGGNDEGGAEDGDDSDWDTPDDNLMDSMKQSGLYGDNGMQKGTPLKIEYYQLED